MSTEHVAVSMDAPVEQPPIEEQLAAVGLDAEGNKAEDTNAEPILGKFQSVEDLAKAYSELEKKLGAGEAPAAASEGDLKITPKEEAPESADMEALLKAGTITQDMYDTFVAGQEAASSAFQSEVYSVAGGEAAYNDLIEWAGDNLSEAEIDTFNDLLGSGNVAAVKMAVSGLAAQRGSSQAQEPNRTIAGGTPPAADKFESWAQVTEAMSDPRYSKDPAFNRAVLEKMARSNL
jgi:ethanolamine utilization microcompartment shell protein EutS